MKLEISHEFTDSLNDYISLNNGRTFDDWLNSLSDKAIMKLEEQLFFGFLHRAKSLNEFTDIVLMIFRMVSLKRKRNVHNLDPVKRDAYMRDLHDKVLIISHNRGLPMMRAGLAINFSSTDSDG
jgi:hypothetical protein